MNLLSSNQEPVQASNPEESKESKQLSSKPNHSQHNHDELDSDCQGCQAQKKQNQKLVDFYQRLDKISTKVKKFKYNQNPEPNHSPNLQNSIQTQTKQPITPQNLSQKLKELQDKISIPELPSVAQIKQFSSKQIGFQLAAALIQREMKYKNQNKKLQDRINQLLAQKKKKQETQPKISNSSFFHPPKIDYLPQNQAQNSTQNQIKDSLDDFKSHKKNHRKNKDDASFWDIDNTSTSNGFKYQQTTFFQTKKRSSIVGIEKAKALVRKDLESQKNQTNFITGQSEKKNLYNTDQGYGLNLWLYQFKAQDYENSIQNSWMSDKNKSQISQRYSIGGNNKQKDSNKSPRIANVNKTSIIQKNLANNDFLPLVQDKRKNH